MAGRVQEFSDVVQPQQLAKDIVMLYQDWKVQKDQKESEWKELRDYLFATDTSTTSNRKLPWKNSTTTPKLAQIRDNLHANYMAALFASESWLKWEGATLEDDTARKREAIEGYLRNKIKASDFEATISKLVYDYIDYGNVFADVIFVNESTEDPATGETIPGYIGPKLIRISPFDIVFNPVAPSFKESPTVTRSLKSIGELKKDALENPELGYALDVIEQMEYARRTLNQFADADWDKAEGYIADGFGSLRQYYESGYVEILEFEGDLYDQTTGEFLQNHIITIFDGAYVARKVKNPSWLGRGSKNHTSWRTRPDNLYGMGPLDNLVGLQYRIDHLENLKADALDLTIHPPKVIRGDVEAFTWEPDAEIHISEDGAVQMLAPDSAAFQVNNEIAYLMELMEEMAGAPRSAMGIRTPGEKTAFEVQTLQNAAGRIFEDKIGKFEKELLEPVLNTMLEVGRRNMRGEEVLRVLDDELGITEFLKITRDDITATGKLRPRGARHFSAQAQFVQNMGGVFGGPLGEIIRPHVSSSGLARAVEELFQWERYDIIRENVAIFEQAETQKLANAAQDQVAADSITPTQEVDDEEPLV